MACKSTMERMNRVRRTVQKYAERRKVLRKRSVDPKLSQEERMEARAEMARQPRDASATRIRNLCAMTGRSRAVYQKFKISRIMLRELALQGKVPGMRKASW
jgi:small subunit ribosomal protein S14